MDSSISMEKLNPIKQYISVYSEYLFLIGLFLTVFFQTFKYYLGILFVAEYFIFFLLIFYIILLLLNIEKIHYNKTLFITYFLFLLLLMYGTIGMFFAQHTENVIYALFQRFISFLNLLVISQYLSTKKRIVFFEFILLFCILWNLGVAVWEITTLQHLPQSQFYGKLSFIPTGTFNNENNLAATFFICSPFLFFIKNKTKDLAIFLLFIILLIITIIGARLLIFVFLPFFVYVFLKRLPILNKLIFCLVVFFAINAIFSKVPLAKEIASRQKMLDFSSFSDETDSQIPGSVEVRFYLMKVALEELGNSYGLGIGSGNFERRIHPDREAYLARIKVAHSLFFDVLATEGIIGFIIVCLIVFSCLRAIVYQTNKSTKSTYFFLSLSEDEKKVMICILFFVVGTTLIGYYKDNQVFWSILGYSYAIIYNKNDNQLMRAL